MSISACAKHHCELFAPFEDDVNGTITIELERTENLHDSIIFVNRSAVIETGIYVNEGIMLRYTQVAFSDIS